MVRCIVATIIALLFSPRVPTCAGEPGDTYAIGPYENRRFQQELNHGRPTEPDSTHPEADWRFDREGRLKYPYPRFKREPAELSPESPLFKKPNPGRLNSDSSLGQPRRSDAECIGTLPDGLPAEDGGLAPSPCNPAAESQPAPDLRRPAGPTDPSRIPEAYEAGRRLGYPGGSEGRKDWRP